MRGISLNHQNPIFPTNKIDCAKTASNKHHVFPGGKTPEAECARLEQKEKEIIHMKKKQCSNRCEEAAYGQK